MSREAPVSVAAKAKVPDKPNRRWWWVVGGSALVIFALMLASAAGGWWLANRAIAGGTSNETAETEVDISTSLSNELTMPDVRGLAQEAAAQVLADSGFAASLITFQDAPSGAPAGIVVTQTPQFGAASPTSITLGVAVPTTMPDVAGMQRDEAVAVLSDLGVAVIVEFQYVSGASVGTIVGTSPVAGEPLGDTATLNLATAGAFATLDQLDRLSGNCRGSGKVSLGGEDFASSVQCRVDVSSQTTVWQFGGMADRFTTTAGIDDTAAPGSVATVEVLGDGAIVASEQVAFGKPVAIDIPVAGTIQLAVRVSALSQVTVVLGEAAVHGTDAAIAELTK